MTRYQAAADILLALTLLGVSGLTAVSLLRLVPEGGRLVILILVQGLLLLGGVRTLLTLRGQRWRNIGLRPVRMADLARGLVALVSCLGVNLLFTGLLFLAVPEAIQTHLDQLNTLAQQLKAGVPLAVLFTVLCFVGVYEEIFARGFLLTRCQVVLEGAWGPILFSSLLFGLGHVYQGWIGVAQTTLVGIVLAVFTLRWGGLGPAMIAHAALDIVSISLMGTP